MSQPANRIDPPGPPNMLAPEDLQAQYSNIVRISHTITELVLDFAHLLPGDPNAQIVARLILSPVGAKLLHRALGDNLARYEASFGEIQLPGDSPLASQLFHPPQ